MRVALAAILAAVLFPSANAASIWAGVYTEAQARRGEAIYPSVCGRCHGYKLDGAPDDPDMFPTPPIAGPKFLRKWNGASLATLFEYTRTTMPEINPASLSDQEFVALIAYMLSFSGTPPGSVELEPDILSLAEIELEPQR
jgi:cytochrome c5